MRSHPSVGANVSLLNPIVPALAHWLAMRPHDTRTRMPQAQYDKPNRGLIEAPAL